MDMNDDVFLESSLSSTKIHKQFLTENEPEDLNKLSPLPSWKGKPRNSLNSSTIFSSQTSSNSSQPSSSPSRRFSFCSSLLASSSTCNSRRRPSLMGSLEIIFGSPLCPPSQPAFHLAFLGQIYRATLEKREAEGKE